MGITTSAVLFLEAHRPILEYNGLKLMAGLSLPAGRGKTEQRRENTQKSLLQKSQIPCSHVLLLAVGIWE